jgi:uncharacterized protein YbjT (DUF2867 family)
LKILVTGASGNIGCYVVEELLKMNEKILVAGTNEQKLKEMFGNIVDLVKLDFTEPGTFQNALIDIDRVFLMRLPHLGKPEDLYPFIDFIKTNDIRLISFLSLMGVEKNYTSSS